MSLFIAGLIVWAVIYFLYKNSQNKYGDGSRPHVDFDDPNEPKYDLPYIKKPYLMTKAEHEFYKVLKEVVGEKYNIIPQVHISSIVQPDMYSRRKYTPRNKIDRKCLDFVLFDKEYFTPKIVIELDDSSHYSKDRIERDEFVDALMAKVGIRIEHVKTAYSYDKEALALKI